jgi:membrane-associated phospholipid phosphatase
MATLQFSIHFFCSIFSYVKEYGFPSTHAMFATGVPFSLVFISHQRYDVNLINQKNRIFFIDFI